MKLLLITLALSVSSINAQEVPLYELITSNVPELGEKTEVYLGDRMLEQRIGEYRECIIPKKTFEKTITMRNYLWSAKANQPICKKEADSKIYYSNYQMVEGGTGPHIARVIENDKTYELHIGLMQRRATFPNNLRFKNINKNDIEINDRWFIYQENSFQQSIEYAGRDGDNLRFNYSEFTDGFARQAFTREFQIDYSKGDVAAYKGAIIKIHDATNVNIVYEVIRNFQQ
jgi:hypothetical protein